VSLPRQTSRFDEHRNTSRVWPVTEQDAENARRALAAFHRSNPALVKWLEDGHPRLTDDEHVARFGESYSGVKSRSRSQVST
jgi:hypothetical protein